jgi:plasmid stabilization system protein ParE
MSAALRTEAADDDLRRIAYQIGVESGRPSVADRIIDELLDACDELARVASFAELGTAAPELGTGIRLFSHRRWVIIFRYIEQGVLILRIADGSQDYLSWKLS